MRLLFVIDHFGPGGAQRQMVDLALGMAGRGQTVEFFIYHPGSRHFAPLLETAGIPIHSCPKRWRLDPRPILALSRLIRWGGYDAVLAYMETPNLYAELARLGRRRPPVVVSERTAFPAGPLPGKVRLRQQGHRLADRVVVNSHHQRERMERDFPWMAPKLLTIENGVSLPLVSGDAAFGEGPLELLAVGRIDPGKNAATLARALAICRDLHGLRPKLRWAGDREHGGEGPRYHAELLGLIADLKLGDQWEWLGVRKDIPDLISRHHAVIHPSLFEGFSNVVCEALASGRPVLAGTIGDQARLIADGRTGFLFDPADPASMAGAIRRLAGLGAGDRSRMGQAARRHAEERLSMEKCVERYLDLFAAI